MRHLRDRQRHDESMNTSSTNGNDATVVHCCFAISGTSNNSWAHDSSTDAPRCPRCGWITDWTWVERDFKLERKRFDASVTNDGHLVVSEKFRSLVGEFDVFQPLPNTAGFYTVIPSFVVRFDEQSVPLRRERFCNDCERWESTTTNGVLASVVSDPVPEETGFARTDVEFAWKDRRKPMLLISLGVALRLGAEGLKGMSLMEVPVIPLSSS